MRIHYLPFMLLVGVLLGSPAVAEAQRQAPLRERAPDDRPGLSPMEVVNLLDAYALVQAQQALQLSDEQYGEFVSRLKRLQGTRRRNVQQRNAILQEMRRLTAPGAPGDEAQIRQRLQALAEHEERAAGEVRQAYRALDEILDVRQQARFRLLEEQLERRKIDLLQRARQGAARGGRQ
jgi:hypothetical protein